MITCPNCKFQNKDSANFCLNCGANLESLNNPPADLAGIKICPSCGGKNEQASLFCGFCGYDFREKPVPVTVQKPRTRIFLLLAGFFTLFITAVAVLILTNPGRAAHTDKILSAIGEAAGEKIGGSTGGILGKLLGQTISTISNELNLSLVEYHNYVFFSTTSIAGRTTSVGYLNNVKIVAPVEDWIDELAALPEVITGDQGTPVPQPTLTPSLTIELTPTQKFYPIGVLDTTLPAPSWRAITTTSGLVYEDLQVGNGATAGIGDSVTVNYVGWLADGTRFDSTIDRGQEFTFDLGTGQVIAGFEEGVLGMNMNGTRLLVLPPELAYGSQGSGSVIPPNAKLIFEVQLVAISHDIVPAASATPVAQSPTATPAGSTPTGKIIYTCEILRDGDVFDQLCMINSDGTGQRQLTDTKGSSYYPALSPDGNHVVFVSNMEGDHDIYELDLTTNDLVRLTSGLGDPTSPRISPDGSLIAFANQRSGVVTLNIMNRDGSNMHAIFSGGGLRPAWSPDGTRLSFYNGSDGSIYIINVDGSNPHTINFSANLGGSTSWSADGNMIAFYKGADEHRQIYIMDTNGFTINQVTNSGDNLSPVFSPDGRWLGFLCYDEGVTDTKAGEICIVRTDGTGLRKLTHNQLLDWLPYWGP